MSAGLGRCPVRGCPVRWPDGVDRRCRDHVDDVDRLERAAQLGADPFALDAADLSLAGDPSRTVIGSRAVLNTASDEPPVDTSTLDDKIAAVISTSSDAKRSRSRFDRRKHR